MTDRPNVLLVLTDQQRWDTAGTYGNPMDVTPTLDEMATGGTTVEHAITPQPLCAPARASLQTGQFPTTHGVWKNGRELPDGPLLGELFRDNGYDTAYVGKWHLATTGTDPVPPERRGGYDYWRAADVLEFTSQPTEGYVYDEDGERLEFDGYRVDAMTDYALEFLRRDREDPFFLFLSHLEPHHQNDMEAYIAPEGYADRYANPHVPPDLRGVPGDWYESLPEYYGCCRRIDERLADLLDELERQGVAEETVVVFTSDHGSHFRTRNGEYKRSPHESSIRVPLVLRGPGIPSGRRVGELVSLLDLPPTLLRAGDIEVPAAMEGRALRPLFEGTAEEWRDDVLVQISESHVGRALRTDRFTYSVFDPTADPYADAGSDSYRERYLYDLRADPHQRVNLVGHGEYAAVAASLRERLADRIEAVEGERPSIAAGDHQYF